MTWLLLFLTVLSMPPLPGRGQLGVEAGPFLQKMVTKWERGEEAGEVTAVTVCGGEVIAATANAGLQRLVGEQWMPFSSDREITPMRALDCETEKLSVISEEGLFLVDLKSGAVEQLYAGKVRTAARWREGWVIAPIQGLLFIHDGKMEPLPDFEQKTVQALAVQPEGKLNIGLADGFAVYEGEGTRTKFYRPGGGGGPRAAPVRDIAVGPEGEVYLATPKGISIFQEDHWSHLTGKNGGLPYEDVLALTVSDESLWVGTSLGAARFHAGRWEYFQGQEYLLSDRVNDVATASGGATWLAAGSGISRVEYRRMTLEEKAAFFEAATRARHVRYGLVADSRLLIPGDLSTNVTATSDNDGLWTAMYIAAECYRFAATGNPEAKEYARASLEALMFLETVTEIPGFVARSFARPDEPHCKGEWDHLTLDGQWRWKGDTSSDEIVGHYYAYSIYYDLCAGETEKEEIRAKIRRITDYIMENDYLLIDTDGQPTTWGRWNFYRPFYRRFRFWDRGLNSLEILSHLKAAYHITGDEKYQRAYEELARRHDYAKFTVRQKINLPGVINHSDDQLAFLSYYPLLKYETDPELAALYRRSLERSWRIEAPEKNPLFNFIYAALMPPGTEVDLEGAVETLQRISLDLIMWDHCNSRRTDVTLSLRRGRFGELESKVPLPPDERSVMKWNGNPYALDRGHHGKREEAGTFWLLPYWMGRYYGFIREK